MIIEKRSAIILTLVIIMITSVIPTTILSVSVAEAGKEKDDNNGKDRDEDDQLSEYDVESLCGASEDYEANKEQCDKLYDMLKEGLIKDDPDYEYD
jgi:hypothetical protein